MLNTRLLAVALGLVLCIAAQAEQAQTQPNEPDTEQEETWRGDTITVIGTRPSPYDADNASVTRMPVGLLETPQSIQVLTPTLLREQEVNSLSDALLNISGVVPSAPT